MESPITEKILSHCGGEVVCRLRDPPQAENPAMQDSFLNYHVEFVIFSTKNQEKHDIINSNEIK